LSSTVAILVTLLLSYSRWIAMFWTWYQWWRSDHLPSWNGVCR